MSQEHRRPLWREAQTRAEREVIEEPAPRAQPEEPEPPVDLDPEAALAAWQETVDGLMAPVWEAFDNLEAIVGRMPGWPHHTAPGDKTTGP